MESNSNPMFEQLKNHPEALQNLMQSRDGQSLLQLLNGQDHGASLQQAALSAARGKPEELSRMIQQVMQSPSGAELVQRIQQAAVKAGKT